MVMKRDVVFYKIINNSGNKRDTFIRPPYLFRGKTISYRMKKDLRNEIKIIV